MSSLNPRGQTLLQHESIKSQQIVEDDIHRMFLAYAAMFTFTLIVYAALYVFASMSMRVNSCCVLCYLLCFSRQATLLLLDVLRIPLWIYAFDALGMRRPFQTCTISVFFLQVPLACLTSSGANCWLHLVALPVV